MNFQQLMNRIDASKPADFGDILSKSFELYKTFFSQGIVHMLIILVCAIPIMLVIYIPIIPLYIEMIQNAGDPYYQPSFFDDFNIGMIVLWYLLVFVLSFFMQIINMSVLGRFYNVMRIEDLDFQEDAGGYFDLAKTHFGKMLVLSLATIAIAVLAAMLCYLPLFYAIVPLHWIYPMFIFNTKLSVMETIKAAFKFANKNWAVFFGLGFVCSIISGLGVILCYIGVILTAFFSYIATYVTYRDTIGFDEANEIDEIGLLEE